MVNSLSRWFGILLLMLSLSSVATLSTLRTNRSLFPSLPSRLRFSRVLKLRLERVLRVSCASTALRCGCHLPRVQRRPGVLSLVRRQCSPRVAELSMSSSIAVKRRESSGWLWRRLERRSVTQCIETRSRSREIYGEGQWVLLKKLIEERQASTIVRSTSRTPMRSRMACLAGEREKFGARSGLILEANRPSREPRARYVEIRLPEMLPVYRQNDWRRFIG